MALLVSWGEQQTFALSVGGFHPDFRDIPTIPALPDGFRNMARIGISLLSDDNPRLKVESYFAVTSNTVQFGAQVELYAAAAGFNVYGFLGYDVLFQFDPFRFIAQLVRRHRAARRHDRHRRHQHHRAARRGPRPGMRAARPRSPSCSSTSTSTSTSPGAIRRRPSRRQTEDLLALLQGRIRRHAQLARRPAAQQSPARDPAHDRAAERQPSRWSSIRRACSHSASGRCRSTDYLIEKFGTRKPLADNKFKLSNANANGVPIAADFQGVREQFAPAQFSALSDSDKLSRRSFERLAERLLAHRHARICRRRCR